MKITHRVERNDPAERYVPREEWGDGPWQDEPDRVEWKTAAGLDALLHRSPMSGSWCGYVAVPPGHPMHGKEYGDEGCDLEAHGGITYSQGCDGHICHEPAPGEPDDVWWFGFDAGHAFDYSPAMEARTRKFMPPHLWSAGPFVGPESESQWRDVYRDLAYMREECEDLAVQLRGKAPEKIIDGVRITGDGLNVLAASRAQTRQHRQ